MIPFVPVFFGGIFHRNVVLERSQIYFFLFYRIFSQEFLWDRNSCIYPGFHRIPPDSSGFLFPPKAVWLRPATKEGSLLSKIWTKIDLFNLSPGGEQDLTMVLPPSSAWPEGDSCRRGRGGCVDGGSTGGCRVGDDNHCNGDADNSRQQTTINNRLGAKQCLMVATTEVASWR